MLSLLFSIFLLPSIFALSTHPHNERILGARNISIEQVPYQVAIYQKDYFQNDIFLMSGSLVAPSYVITVATYVIYANETDLTVRAGSSTVGEGQVVQVTKIHLYPESTDPLVGFVVAVLELETSMQLGFTVAIIQLPRANQTWPVGTEGLLTGWGSVLGDSVAGPVDDLQGVTLPLMSYEACHAHWNNDSSEYFFCAGSSVDGSATCNRDMGDPLQIDGVLVGMALMDSLCGWSGIPGIFTNVASVVDFVQDVIAG